MTKHIADATSSWRTRAGIALVLLVALLGVVVVQQRGAEAALPMTTATLDQAPAGPATVNPGTAVTYTLTANLTAAPSGSAVLNLELNYDADLLNAALLCSAPAGPTQFTSGPAAGNTDCHWHGAIAGTYTLTLTGNIGSAALTGPTGTVCEENVSDIFTCSDESGADVVAATPTANVGTLSAVGVTGSATPNPIVVGGSSTVTFSIPPGITYCSDGIGADARAFTATDQTVTGGTATTTTPDTNLDTVTGTHTVVVTSAAAGTVSVALSTHLSGSAAGAGCTSTTVDVTVQSVAAFLGDAVLRHVDPDQAAEDQADGNLGVLDVFEDVDDAIGSFHTACIMDSPLTSADNAFITWNITATELNPTASLFTEISGDDLPLPIGDVPCAQWASAAVGDQEISATYDPDGAGPIAGINILFDGLQGNFADSTNDLATQPLVKEWNSIDVTRIVSVSGTVGDGEWCDEGANNEVSDCYDGEGSIADNTGELANWDSGESSTACERDRDSASTLARWCGSRANADGTVVAINGALTVDGNVAATGKSFIDYTIGAHTTHYNGPIDGAEQTYTYNGCGSLLLEDPVTGDVILLGDGDSATVLSSNYGVGFTFLATDVDGFFSCAPGESGTVTVTTGQQVVLTSAEDTAPPETVTVNFFAPQVAKQPLLAWAGQRIVLAHTWLGVAGDLDTCFATALEPRQTADQVIGIGDPYARYEIERGDGAFVPTEFLGNPEGDDVFHASLGGISLPESDPCTSYAVYEQEFQGQVDIKATLEFCDFLLDNEAGQFIEANDDNCVATGFVYNFLVYYMEFEDITLGIVGGDREFHNAGPFHPTGNINDATTDTATATANVSADVLLRARVRGWFKTDSLDTSGTNRPAADGKPAGRFVMPDDWLLLAGGDTALLFRPNYDIMLTPGGSLSCGSPEGCDSSTAAGVPATSALTTCGNDPVVGPFSLLDLGPCNGNSAEFGGRETWLSDGQINRWDAPMPPALVTFAMVGDTATSTATSSGFLKEANKYDDVYSGQNPYYLQAIPESPIISPQNYLFDSWEGWPGDDPTAYIFWQTVLTNRFPNTFAASVFSTNTELAQIQGEYGPTIGRILSVYSDNHGEAMVFANGDFRLTYAECSTNVIGGGKECAQGDDVGTSNVFAVADYPDFKKKPQIASTPVAITWEWGGYKEVTIEPGETDQFRYIVFHALDRDGLCTIPLVQATTYDLGANSRFEGTAVGGGVNDRALKPIYLSGTSLTFTNTGTPYLVRRTVSLHPVLSSIDAENTIGANDPVESVDFTVDAGEGIVLTTSNGTGNIDPTKRFVTGVPTYSTSDNTTIKEFPTLHGSADECQAWIRVSNSLLGVLNVIVVAHDDEGDIGFDTIVDFQGTFSYTLNFRWSLITWMGADNIPVADALKGTGANDAGNDIFDQVTAVYGWDQAAQQWLGFFPSGVDVPGANDLTALQNGEAYWIAIKGPGTVTWTVATNVGG